MTLIKKQIHYYYIRTISSLIWLNENFFFYPKLKRFYNTIIKGEKEITIIDVGANRGQSIDFFLAIMPKATIHSFEPNPRLFKFLKKKYVEHNINLYEKGISAISGRMPFHEHVLDETSGFEKATNESSYNCLKNKVLLTKKASAIKASYDVLVTTLDAFVNEKNIDHVDILKIDVEGHELQAIQGCVSLLKEKKIRLIQLEQHFDDQYNAHYIAIENILNEAGYREIMRLKHGFGNFFEIIYCSE